MTGATVFIRNVCNVSQLNIFCYILSLAGWMLKNTEGTMGNTPLAFTNIKPRASVSSTALSLNVCNVTQLLLGPAGVNTKSSLSGM